jgi:hypothetical protein
LEKMVSSQDLRDKASRCYLLARSITSTRDIAHFEALGAEADQAAAEMEAEEDATWLSSSNENRTCAFSGAMPPRSPFHQDFDDDATDIVGNDFGATLFRPDPADNTPTASPSTLTRPSE